MDDLHERIDPDLEAFRAIQPMARRALRRGLDRMIRRQGDDGGQPYNGEETLPDDFVAPWDEDWSEEP